MLGSSGQLRPHNLRASADTAIGFDTDHVFALMEIAGDELYFQIVSRNGETVDSGVLENNKNKKKSGAEPSRAAAAHG